MVVRQEINYLRPIRFSIEPLMTRTWFSHIGTSSLTMETQLIDGGSWLRMRNPSWCVSIRGPESCPTPSKFQLLFEEHLAN